jgi:hypothetical protein
MALSLICLLHKSPGHAKSSQSSLAASWQRIYNGLTVITAHIKSSFHMPNLLFTVLPSIQFWSDLSVNLSLSLSLSVIRRITTDCQSASLSWNEAPIEGSRPHFIPVRQLRVCWCEALSLTRERVRRLQLLLSLASEFILGSQSHGTRDHILLSQIRDFPFHRLQRLAGLRWRYSTLPPHGSDLISESESQSQSYFTTGGLPPIVHLGAEPLETHGRIFFSIEQLRS